MSALEAFVNEQKRKNNVGSSSFSSLADLKNKISNSVSIGGLSLLSRSETSDTQSLVADGSGDGQLPQGKNRKNVGGFFSILSSDEGMCGLTRTQRIFAFFLSLMGAFFCFTTAAFLIPIIIVSTRKFAALNTLGSVMLLMSFAFLWGPSAYVQHLASPQRRLVTVAYLSAVFATLYSSLWLQSTVFTLIAALFQGFTLIWFVMSYVPGGERGLRFITSIFTGFIKKPSGSVLPI